MCSDTYLIEVRGEGSFEINGYALYEWHYEDCSIYWIVTEKTKDYAEA
jgi:hypothetical protein